MTSLTNIPACKRLSPSSCITRRANGCWSRRLPRLGSGVSCISGGRTLQSFRARTRSPILHRVTQETSTVGPATARFQEYASPAAAFEAQPSTSVYCRAWPRRNRSINSTTSQAFQGAVIFTPGWPRGLSAGPWKSATRISEPERTRTTCVKHGTT